MSVGLTIFITAAALTLGALLWMRVRLRRPSAMKSHAKLVISDPDYRTYLQDRLARRKELLEAAEQAGAPASHEFQALVRDLISTDEDLAEAATSRLCQAPDSAIPVLLEALQSALRADVPARRTPALRISSILLGMRCRTLGDHLLAYTDDDNNELNWTAIEARAATGREAYADAVIRDLESSGVRSTCAEKGVDRSHDMGWAEPVFTRAILDWARSTTIAIAPKSTRWGMQFYLRHGGPEALQAIAAPPILSLDNSRSVGWALQIIADAGMTIDHDLLNAFLDKSLSVSAFPWPFVFKPALGLLHRTSPTRAKQLALQCLDNGSDLHVSVAIDFIRQAESLPQPWQIHPPPTLVLTPDERRILDPLDECGEVFGQVGNGGLSQYFFNCSGDRWRQAAAALEAIGHPDGGAALRQAAHIVHSDGASVDREVRMRQYAALSEAAEAQLNALGGQFGSRVSNRVQLIYMRRHKDLFQRIRQARLDSGMDSD